MARGLPQSVARLETLFHSWGFATGSSSWLMASRVGSQQFLHHRVAEYVSSHGDLAVQVFFKALLLK